MANPLKSIKESKKNKGPNSSDSTYFVYKVNKYAIY